MRKSIWRIFAIVPALILVIVPVMPSVANAAPIINEYSLSSNPSGSFPTSIAKGPDGNLWFTVHLAGSIGRITTNGNVVEYPLPSTDGDPNWITAGPDNAMWFTEPNAGRIGRIATNGDITGYSLPAGDSAVNIISGPDGSLWFTGAHAINNNVTTNGIIGNITTSGVITDYSTGNYLPNWLAFSPDGALWFTNIYTVSGDNNTGIGKFATSGSISAFYPLSSPNWQPSSITTGPDGALWFGDQAGVDTVIGRITDNGDISSFPVGITGSSSNSITTGPDGALWFTDWGTNSVGRITTSGTVTEYAIHTSNAYPQSIATGPDGALWFVEQGSANKIGQLVLNPSPAAPTNLTAASPARFPNLSWSSVTGAASYNLYRNGSKIGSTMTTSYTDNSAPEGTNSYYVTAVNSGGESAPSNTVSVLVDRTAPTITYTVNPTPNSNGWNNSSPVTVSFTCTDNTGGSGIAICPAPQTESTEGSFTLSGTAIDNAGNSATTNVTVNIDSTAPVLGTPSWTNNPMTTTQTATVSVPVTDNLSGVSNGEYYLGTTDPGQGSGTPMTLSSGNLTASFSGLTPGIYTANFRAEDVAANWSPVTTDYLVVYDATQTSADGHSNKIVPVYGSDVLPGLIQAGQTDTAAFAFTVKYNNGGLVTASKVHFSYKTGTSCNSPNATNCHSTTLDSTSIAWMIVNGTNNSLATVQGTATLTIDGVTTTNPFRLIATDGAQLSPSTNDQFELDVYAPGANPNTAQPIYHMNEPVTNGNVVVVR